MLDAPHWTELVELDRHPLARLDVGVGGRDLRVQGHGTVRRLDLLAVDRVQEVQHRRRRLVGQTGVDGRLRGERLVLDRPIDRPPTRGDPAVDRGVQIRRRGAGVTQIQRQQRARLGAGRHCG